MPTYPHTQALRYALTAELARLQRDLDTSAQASANEAQKNGAQPDDTRRFGGPATPTPAARQIVEQIDSRIGKLEQVRDWIDEDEYLGGLIDSVIGKQVRASERRQSRVNIVLNIVFLLGGWLLSLVGTPVTLAQIFHH